MDVVLIGKTEVRQTYQVENMRSNFWVSYLALGYAYLFVIGLFIIYFHNFAYWVGHFFLPETLKFSFTPPFLDSLFLYLRPIFIAAPSHIQEACTWDVYPCTESTLLWSLWVCHSCHQIPSDLPMKDLLSSVSFHSYLCCESWSLGTMLDPLYFLLSPILHMLLSMLVSKTELIKLYSFGIVQGFCLSRETSLDLSACVQGSSPSSPCFIGCVLFSVFSGWTWCLGLGAEHVTFTLCFLFIILFLFLWLVLCFLTCWHKFFWCFFLPVPDPGRKPFCFSTLIQFTHLSLTVTYPRFFSSAGF